MAATASPLFARGYMVIPEPQKVTLTGQDFEFASSWRLELGPGVKANDIAVESLELQERFHIALSEAKGKGGPSLKLAIDPRSVEVGDATDKEKSTLAERTPDYLDMARLCFALGDRNQGFAYLDQAYEVRDQGALRMGLAFLNGAYFLEDVRNDPRFGALLKKIGLPAAYID